MYNGADLIMLSMMPNAVLTNAVRILDPACPASAVTLVTTGTPLTPRKCANALPSVVFAVPVDSEKVVSSFASM
jgi:hypothetical protein